MEHIDFDWKLCSFYGGRGWLSSGEKVIEYLGREVGLNVGLGFKTAGGMFYKNLKLEGSVSRLGGDPEEGTDLYRVVTYPHLVTVSYGRNPIWLLWLTTVDGLQMSLWVNLVTHQVIRSPVRFANWLYTGLGTVFEGEILGRGGSERERARFMIGDLLVHDGKLYKGNLWSKIGIWREILSHQYVKDPVIDCLDICAKEFVELKYLQSFYDQKIVEELGDIQGLLIVPVDRSFKIYQVRNIGSGGGPVEIKKVDLPKDDDFREKEQEFWVEQVEGMPDNYKLYGEIRGELVYYEVAMIDGVERSGRVDLVFREKEGVRKEGVEGQLLKFKCQFNKRFQKWMPNVVV